MEEESDIDLNGGYTSHFELYLKAMQDIGADTTVIQELVSSVRRGGEINRIIDDSKLPNYLKSFLLTTAEIITSKSNPKIASSIYFARENLIPVIFPGFIENINEINSRCKMFQYYLERHVELDSNSHSKLARQALISICGNDKAKWEEAEKSAKISLKARLVLWDGIISKLNA